MTPEGYGAQNYYRPLRTCDEMGYNVTLRLAFLRKYRLDPIDLVNPQYPGFQARANTALPPYDGYDYELQQKWNAFRAETLGAAQRELFESVWNGASDPKPGLLIAQEDGQGFMAWYDEWNDPNTPLPSGYPNSPPPAANAKPGEAPKLPVSVLFLSKATPTALPKELAKYDWMDIQMKIMEFYKQMRKWDGIVVEE